MQSWSKWVEYPVFDIYWRPNKSTEWKNKPGIAWQAVSLMVLEVQSGKCPDTVYPVDK